MESYEGFAEVYDELMDNIPYDEWCQYIVELLKEYNITEGLVAELGCGTGNVTTRLSNAGYDMIGIDNSYEMLEIAREKLQSIRNEEFKESEDSDASILYLNQDMREFELFGTVNAIICVCDSINYLTETEDITEVFKLANNYLEENGIFICDFKTKYFFKEIAADRTIAEDREDVSFIWENYYDEETDINELALSLFICQDEDEQIYKKYQEFHYQKGLTINDMKECVKASGMELIAMYDAFTHSPATKNSERVYIIARETKQENKYYVN